MSRPRPFAPSRKRGLAAAALALASGLASLSFASGQAPAEPDRAVSVTAAAKEAAAARDSFGGARGKPMAAFTLDYTLEGEIHAAGVPLQLRISLRPQSNMDNIAVQVSADAGLYVDPADSLLTAASVTPDAPAEWVVHVTPVDEGRFHVKLYAEGDLGGSRQGRSVMVPIQVGMAKNTAEATQKVGGDGAERDLQTESLIRLPADPR